MKALICDAPGRLAVRDVPSPVRGDGEVLLRIRRVGICGTDFHIFEGLHPFLAYPRVMGHELAAEVVTAPPSSPLRTGELAIVYPYLYCGRCRACLRGKSNCCARISVLGVHRDGGMCEQIAVPEANVIAAGTLDVDEAATVEFLAIGAHAIRRSGADAQTRLLVIGAGPIGLGTALFGQIAGASVTLLDRDRERLALARDVAGIERTVHTDEAQGALAAATEGDGFDVVIDATGNLASIEAGFAHVAHGGAYVLVSIVKGDITFNDAEFHKREMTLIGSRNATHADFAHVMASIRAGRVPVARLITQRTRLTDAAADLARWSGDKSGLIKAFLVLD